jgi:exodeoxyribonuclease VII large subunit
VKQQELFGALPGPESRRNAGGHDGSPAAKPPGFELASAAPAAVESSVAPATPKPLPVEILRVAETSCAVASPAEPPRGKRVELERNGSEGASAASKEAPPVPAWRQPRAEPKVLSVSELTWQLKDLVEPAFAHVVVRGEVSGFRGPNARGHLYFAIKDERAAIDVKVWASAAQRLTFKLKDGLAVVIEGSVDVYAVQGRYSLIAQRVEPDGVGARALAFEQLKARLAAEGLIGEKRKKPRLTLPLLPRRIGVVTSVTGAALRDFLTVLHRRHPRLPVLVADARVQGEGAAIEVSRAIRALGRTDVDVIVVTRGGGSVDDLWTFNEEPIARAIFEAKVPVVSAVGHEIDTTLADLVADVRAPTPSAAAEAVAPVLSELELQLATSRARLVRAVTRMVQAQRTYLRALKSELGDPRRALSGLRLMLAEAAERMARVLRRKVREGHDTLEALQARLQRARPQAQLDARRAAFEALERRLLVAGQRTLWAERANLSRLSVALERASPRPAIRHARQVLAHTAARLSALGRTRLSTERQTLEALTRRLDALSPLKVLGRGYAIVSRTEDGQVVRRAGDVKAGDAVKIRLGEGELAARVTGSTPGAK